MPMSPCASASAHQHRGHGRALLHRAAELLGHADHRQAELVGLAEQLGAASRRRRRRAAAAARSSFEREVAHRVAQHLLLVGGAQVEQVARGSRGWRAGRDSCWAAANVRPARAAVRDRRLRGPVEEALGRVAQAETVDRARRRRACSSARRPTAMPRSARFGEDIGLAPEDTRNDVTSFHVMLNGAVHWTQCTGYHPRPLLVACVRCSGL